MPLLTKFNYIYLFKTNIGTNNSYLLTILRSKLYSKALLSFQVHMKKMTYHSLFCLRNRHQTCHIPLWWRQICLFLQFLLSTECVPLNLLPESDMFKIHIKFLSTSQHSYFFQFRGLTSTQRGNMNMVGILSSTADNANPPLPQQGNMRSYARFNKKPFILH